MGIPLCILWYTVMIMHTLLTSLALAQRHLSMFSIVFWQISSMKWDMSWLQIILLFHLTKALWWLLLTECHLWLFSGLLWKAVPPIASCTYECTGEEGGGLNFHMHNIELTLQVAPRSAGYYLPYARTAQRHCYTSENMVKVVYRARRMNIECT